MTVMPWNVKRNAMRMLLLPILMMLCGCFGNGQGASVRPEPTPESDECVSDFLEASEKPIPLPVPDCVRRALIVYATICTE